MLSPNYIDDYLISKAFSGQSRLVLGTSGLGGVWGQVDATESIATILYGLENGISAFDTAPSYGQAQKYLGVALKRWNGDRPFVSTKVGRLASANAFEFRIDFTPTGMRDSLHRSLELLGLDKINLLFLHEPQLVPRADIPGVIEALGSFKEEGWADQIGVGGNPGPDFRPYIMKENFDVVSGFLRMNACNLSVFDGEIQHYLKEGIAYYAASPLHFSLLGKRYNEYQEVREISEWVTHMDLNNAKKVKAIADQNGMSLSSLAQRFLFTIKEADRVVVGASNLSELKDTLADWKQGRLPKFIFDEIISTVKR